MDNKKRRTSDGHNHQHGLDENTELFLGSDDENAEDMDQDQNKNVTVPKNANMANSGTSVHQSS